MRASQQLVSTTNIEDNWTRHQIKSNLEIKAIIYTRCPKCKKALKTIWYVEPFGDFLNATHNRCKEEKKQ